MVKAEERVNKFINEIKGIIGVEKVKIIRDTYEIIKPSVCEDLYMDIVSVCVTVALNGEEVTKENLINTVRESLGLNDNGREVLALRSLCGNDAMTIDDPRSDAIDDVMDRLITSKDLKNAIFLDILNGESELVVAKKYRLTVKEIKDIYDERLGFVESILVVDHDILIKDVESREPIKSNTKIVTEPTK